MGTEEPFPGAGRPTAPLPRPTAAPSTPDAFPAAAPTVAGCPTAAVAADTVSRGQRTVRDRGAAVAAA